MNRSSAYDPRSVTAKYPSFFRWSRPAVAQLGDLFPTTHWTNKLFTPLDFVFSHDDLQREAEVTAWQQQPAWIRVVNVCYLESWR